MGSVCVLMGEGCSLLMARNEIRRIGELLGACQQDLGILTSEEGRILVSWP